MFAFQRGSVQETPTQSRLLTFLLNKVFRSWVNLPVQKVIRIDASKLLFDHGWYFDLILLLNTIFFKNLQDIKRLNSYWWFQLYDLQIHNQNSNDRTISATISLIRPSFTAPSSDFPRGNLSNRNFYLEFQQQTMSIWFVCYILLISRLL